VHSTTGYSPHELFYSFCPTCPLDAMVDVPSEGPADNTDTYALQAAERLRESFAFMRAFSGKQTERMKKYYDASVKPKTFSEGSFVLLYSPKKKRGVYSRWQVTWLGPFRVTKKLNETNYVIQKSLKSKAFIVHADRLKLYHGDVAANMWPESLPIDSTGTDTASKNRNSAHRNSASRKSARRKSAHRKSALGDFPANSSGESRPLTSLQPIGQPLTGLRVPSQPMAVSHGCLRPQRQRRPPRRYLP